MHDFISQAVMELKLNKSDWSLVKFGDVATKQNSSVDRENTHLKRYIKGEHMSSEDIHLREWGDLVDEYLGPAFTRYFEKGDVLYGSRRTYLRKVTIAPFEGITSNTTFVIKANENMIDKNLLPFLMLSEEFTQHSIRNSKGSVNPYINWKDIANYEFLLPPKAQQAKIAELLWAMDEVLQKDIKVSEKLNSQYVTRIERELLQKKAKKITLGELGTIVRGVGYKPQDLLDEYGTDCSMLLRSNNISKSKINFENIYIVPNDKIKKEQFLIKDDFAICMSNGSKELVGKAAKFTPNDKNVVVGSFCAVMRPKSMISADLLEHLFASESYRFAIKRTLSGSAINNLKPSDIEGLSLNLNENIQEVKQTLVSLCALLDASKYINYRIQTSKALQKSLINEIF